MSDNNFIKQASKHLRDTLKQNLHMELGSSHAHALISAALGYNTKKALIDADCEDNEFILHEKEGKINVSKIDTLVGAMNNSPLQSLEGRFVHHFVKEALTPACECCGAKTVCSQPLFEPDDPDAPIAQVCGNCSDDEEEYDTCRYCGPNTLYRSSAINAVGECCIHEGESVMDDDEQADWDSYVEYINKDS